MTYFRSLTLFTVLLASAPAGSGKPGDAKVEEPDKESGEQRLELFDNNKAEAMCKIKGKVCVRAAPSMEASGSEALPAIKRGSANKGDWVIDLYINGKKPALAGTAQFIFSDVEESKSSKSRDVTALYQQTLKAVAGHSARARLSNDEGFRAGRTYHVYIAQQVGGKEVVLAEGDFQLK